MKKETLLQRSDNAGFSVVETGIAALVICVIAGFAVLTIPGIMPGINANTCLNQTVAQLRSGRELAIAQRRSIELRFVGNDQVELVRFDVPAGRTVLSTIMLEGDMQFLVFGGIPDTPDAFGNGTAVAFGGPAPFMFLSDGALVDAQGNPINGSVFLGLIDHPETARAVTILGATGRVRGYRWSGTSWIH